MSVTVVNNTIGTPTVIDGRVVVNVTVGEDGDTPEIGINGNWFIKGVDTGLPSRGIQGEPGIGVEDEQIAAVYVSKVGDDLKTGLSVNQSKLTITAAITTAETLITAGATGVRITVIDGSSYTENITVPTNIAVDAKGATLIGSVNVTGGSEIFLDRHVANANNQAMLTCEGAGTGPAIYWSNISDGRGESGTLTGVRNIRNIGGGGKNLFARVGILYTGISGVGVGDVSSGNAGHIHIELLDLYLAGNNSIGVLGASQGGGNANIVGWIDHILEIGSPTGTVGISMTAAGAVVKLTASEIVADTAYNIVSGSLYLSCPKITGLTVGTPAQRMLGTGEIAADTPIEGNILRSDGTKYVGITEVDFLQNKDVFDKSAVGSGYDIDKVFAWDNFIRPNNASTIGVADSGQTWQQLGAFNRLGITDNSVYGVNESGVRAEVIQRTVFGGSGSNGQGSVKLEGSFFKTGSISLGLLIAKDENNYLYCFLNVSTLTLRKVIAGVESDVLTVTGINGSLSTTMNDIKFYLRSRSTSSVLCTIQSGFQGNSSTLSASDSALFSELNSAFIGLIKPEGSITNLSTCGNFKATNLFRI
jgi:hypothetical protein